MLEQVKHLTERKYKTEAKNKNQLPHRTCNSSPEEPVSNDKMYNVEYKQAKVQSFLSKRSSLHQSKTQWADGVNKQCTTSAGNRNKFCRFNKTAAARTLRGAAMIVISSTRKITESKLF